MKLREAEVLESKGLNQLEIAKKLARKLCSSRANPPSVDFLQGIYYFPANQNFTAIALPFSGIQGLRLIIFNRLKDVTKDKESSANTIRNKEWLINKPRKTAGVKRPSKGPNAF